MILQPDDAGIARALEALRAGAPVAFPTETVYGLGADAASEPAVRAVFERKGRPAWNPLIVHVDGAPMARTVVADWPERAAKLADRFWPGPLTLVLEKAPGVPDIVTAGGPTIAVRAPDHPVALRLIGAFGAPLVAPSANRSGAVSPTTAAHVEAAFPDILILDGGACRGGIESTVVDLTGPARILRPGLIGAAALREALGEAVIAPEEPDAAPPGPARSPGQRGPHYSPRARVRLGEAPEASGAAPAGAVRLALGAASGAGVIGMPADARAYAARLYAALREADESGASEIRVELPGADRLAGPEAEIWGAIVDRLRRAAAER